MASLDEFGEPKCFVHPLRRHGISERTHPQTEPNFPPEQQARDDQDSQQCASQFRPTPETSSAGLAERLGKAFVFGPASVDGIDLADKCPGLDQRP